MKPKRTKAEILAEIERFKASKPLGWIGRVKALIVELEQLEK